MKNTVENIETLSPLQRSVLVIERLKSKLNALESARTEPIAIIGMGCRFPGEATSPEKFWQLLAAGRDAISTIPSERWDVEAYYDPDPEAKGKMYARSGGFLSQVDEFDPLFFGISPREAVSIDPQHRLLLEVTWEALEQAGQVPEQLAGSPTGVFVGITLKDYGNLVKQATAEEEIDYQAYGVTGLPLNAAPGRIAYTLGSTGPALAIDTACSSSLVAVHQACQSLRQGECQMALAGGVNLILSPDSMISTAKAKMLSADGRCKTFDTAADGIGRGEGCGVIVLKRLSAAVAAGDPILALIRGSAVNQDGPSSGFTVPSRTAQEQVIRQAITQAQIAPEQVNYVEAHGTGTALGDPIEMKALGAVLGAARPAAQPLTVGSAKTNLGHLESAAGVAGLIKTVLQLQHQQIAPHLHLRQPSPYINWADLPVVVPTQLQPWPIADTPRIAGVSSFGASGTNAHVVLAEAPAPDAEPDPVANALERPLHLLTLSAKTEDALTALVAAYRQQLAAQPDLSLADLCFSANTGRSHFNHRLAIVAGSTSELGAKLAAAETGQADTAGYFRGHFSVAATPPKVAFLFTGQGAQYVGMGEQLYQTHPVFRQALEQCDEILRPYLDCSLLEILYPAQAQTGAQSARHPVHIDQTAYTQPALFAVEYALVQLWKSWGIEPDVVMGHSIGEYVAACVAGVLSLEEGLKLIAARGRLMQALPAGGEMVSVLASAAQVEAVIAAHAPNQRVDIAAINGPQSTVISGDGEAVQRVCQGLAAAEVKTKPLSVSHAFHSALMTPMLADFEAIATTLTYSPPRIKMLSTVTGQRVSTEIATADYWCHQIRQPVNFAAGMETLYQQGYRVFVEIGPRPVLLSMGCQCLPSDSGVWVPSLRPSPEPALASSQSADWRQLLNSLGQLYQQGLNINWSEVDRVYARQRVDLPTYPFQRQRYWINAANREIDSTRSQTSTENDTTAETTAQLPVHFLLGNRLTSLATCPNTSIWQADVNRHYLSYLKDHRVWEAIVMPHTAYVEMALAAAEAVFGEKPRQLTNLQLHHPLFLSEQGQQKIQTTLTHPAEEKMTFQVHGCDGSSAPSSDRWTLYATAEVAL
ncbi:MAG: type I polyketide synthase [Phormidesmis sp.]